MSKRRLSLKQQRNIAKTKQQKEYRHDEDINLEPPLKGRVIAHQGKLLIVETEQDLLLQCKYRQNLGSIVTGDRVIIQKEIHLDHGIITGILPRTTLLLRPKKLSRTPKPVAANIDQMIIVIATEPAPIEHYIDRYLVAASAMGFHAIIAVNKMDLYENAPHKQQMKNLIALYRQLGYQVEEVSAITRARIDALQQRLTGKTSIFVGQSGVGKSEILNALIGTNIAQTGEISAQNLRGKHTTTTARLYHLNDNSDIIDSPGIREFGIWHLTTQDLFDGFVEFREFAGRCRFRNCEHLPNTKGCAIDEAVQSGLIHPDRFQNYHRLMQEYLELGSSF
ncbi:MAG: ribosome small subunit-dependent GTPase A [Francisellaceae bacterium]